MKIAQIICTFPPYKGGMGTVAYEFTQRLSQRGHDVTVFTPKYQEDEIQREYPFKVIKMQSSFKLGNAAVLSNIRKQLVDFDMIHLHYPFFGTAYFVYRFKKKFPNKSLVITYHMDAIAGGLKGLIFKIHSKILMPKILSKADVITVSSIDYIQNSNARYIYRKHPERFVELPFGVDIDHFKPAEKDHELMNRFGIQYSDKIILFIGGLDKAHNFKGLKLLIKANKILATQLKDFKTIIVGEGDLKNHYEELVKKFNLENKIKFVGVGKYADLPKYYNLSDLLVLPSTNRAEAFGLVLLEAMACGKAVLASNLAGVRTVPISQDYIFQTGNVKDLTDKIYQLLTNDNLRVGVGKVGRIKVEEGYTWKHTISKLERTYVNLIIKNK